jgi:type II secretory pathway pseudopilin PulG
MRAKTRIPRHAAPGQAGYVLLTLLLFVTLVIIAAAAVAPKIAFSIHRDREQELIHRGVQYTRAIRAFSRKFGRYPNTIDELQNINGQRFLRKRYKDPITGQEFKLLHLTDVQFSGGPGVAALTQGSRPAAPGSAFARSNGTAVPATPPPTGQDPNTPADPNASTDANAAPGTAAQSSTPPLASPITPTPADASGNSTGTSSFGGGAIVGVVSRSKERSIREFGHKTHYNDWQFYYDPGYDRGFVINGPTVKTLIGSSPLTPGTTPDSSEPAPPQLTRQ